MHTKMDEVPGASTNYFYTFNMFILTNHLELKHALKGLAVGMYAAAGVLNNI